MNENDKRIELLWGENDYLKKEYLNSLINKYSSPNQESFSEVSHCNGKSVSIEELQNTLMTIPFFAEFHLVIIYNLFERFKNLANNTRKQGKNANRSDWDQIVALFTNIPNQKTIVLVEDLYPENKIIVKDILQLIDSKEFKTIAYLELENWISKRLLDNGKKISNRNARLIADYVGNDMWTLSNEIEKIINFCQNEVVEEEHLEILINNPKEMKIFKLVDLLLDQNIAVSFKNIPSIFESGYSTQYLLSMLSRQMRLLIIAKQLSHFSSPKKIYKEKLGIYSDYVIDNIISQVGNRDMDVLMQLYEKISELDIAIKTGAINENIVFDNLISNRIAN
tara:strand:- start:8194 stop:9204 length:1011 start_codon:yes stop_codon:yes gene_type:complete